MKTMQNVLIEKYPDDYNRLYFGQVVEIMKFVREETLKECAKKAVVTMLITEGAIMKNEKAILSLDKNSLDL